MTKSVTPGEPLRWLKAKLAELAANPTDECVDWPFRRTPHGYPQMYFDHLDRNVSEVVLTLTVGPRPAGMQACHKPVVCHNRACVNPRHLRWDTPRNNSRDKLLDGTQARGVNIRQSKLSERDAWEIRELHATGEWTGQQLATEFQVSAPTISFIVNGKAWRHIEGVPPTSPRDHPPLFT